MLFLLLLATFRPRPPEVNKIVGGVFVDANSAERRQKVEHLDLCKKMSLTNPHDSLITNLAAICATASIRDLSLGHS